MHNIIPNIILRMKANGVYSLPRVDYTSYMSPVSPGIQAQFFTVISLQVIRLTQLTHREMEMIEIMMSAGWLFLLLKWKLKMNNGRTNIENKSVRCLQRILFTAFQQYYGLILLIRMIMRQMSKISRKMMNVKPWDLSIEVSTKYSIYFDGLAAYGVKLAIQGIKVHNIYPKFFKYPYKTGGYCTSKYNPAATNCTKSNSCTYPLDLTTTLTTIHTNTATTKTSPITLTTQTWPYYSSPQSLYVYIILVNRLLLILCWFYSYWRYGILRDTQYSIIYWWPYWIVRLYGVMVVSVGEYGIIWEGLFMSVKVTWISQGGREGQRIGWLKQRDSLRLEDRRIWSQPVKRLRQRLGLVQQGWQFCCQSTQQPVGHFWRQYPLSWTIMPPQPTTQHYLIYQYLLYGQ